MALVLFIGREISCWFVYIEDLGQAYCDVIGLKNDSAFKNAICRG